MAVSSHQRRCPAARRGGRRRAAARGLRGCRGAKMVAKSQLRCKHPNLSHCSWVTSALADDRGCLLRGRCWRAGPNLRRMTRTTLKSTALCSHLSKVSSVAFVVFCLRRVLRVLCNICHRSTVGGLGGKLSHNSLCVSHFAACCSRARLQSSTQTKSSLEVGAFERQQNGAAPSTRVSRDSWSAWCCTHQQLLVRVRASALSSTRIPQPMRGVS